MKYIYSYVRKSRYSFIKSVMDHYNVKYNEILCRDKGEQYSNLVEGICPDILIEESIGGKKKWCITNVNEEIKRHIKSIVVEEFSGIDHVENDL